MSLAKLGVRIEVYLRSGARRPKLIRRFPEKNGATYIEIQLEMETIRAVPAPRFDVGEKTLAAQLLFTEDQEKLRDAMPQQNAYMTRGNKL